MKNNIKLIASEVIHKLNIFPIGNKLQKLDKQILKGLYNDGFYVLESFLSKEKCDKLINEANSFLLENESTVSKESNGADLRVYGINDFTNKFNIPECLNISKRIFSKFSFIFDEDHMLLLGKIKGTKDNLGSGSGWHRDSPFSHQFKTLLFLKDVTIKNGPFQYVKGSHKFSEIKKYSKFLDIPLSKHRFSNEEIDRLIKAKVILEPTTFVAKAGTLAFADVRGLHRGSPIIEGERIALTNYHFARKRKNYYTIKN